MKIKTARFVVSNQFVDKCPESACPEYAFIGRSNVGKSSLINALTNRTSLAKTSATPGKTMLINHFFINEEWYLVDLPGYGFAMRSKKDREKLEYTITRYILEREQLTAVCVLIDVRHSPQQIDTEFLTWLGENNVPFVIVFTKSDKLGKTQLQHNLAEYKKYLLKSWEELPNIFLTSSQTKQGCQDLLDWIESVNASL